MSPAMTFSICRQKILFLVGPLVFLSLLVSFTSLQEPSIWLSTLLPSKKSTSKHYPIEYEVAAKQRLKEFQPARGVRYLFEKYGILLIVLPFDLNNHKIEIVNYYDSSGGNPFCAPENNLRMWVRFAGTEEVVTGLAVADGISNNKECRWSFTPEQPLLSGTYEVDVKVMAINDNVEVHEKRCNIEKGKKIVDDMRGSKQALPTLRHLMSYKPFAVKSYEQLLAVENAVCCEICTSLKECTHFHVSGQGTRQGCHLYDYNGSYNDTIASLPPQHYATAPMNESQAVGTSRNITPQTILTKFLGCGYGEVLESNGTFCKANGTDDMPHIVEPIFTIVHKTEHPKDKDANLPICPSNLDGVGHGRWVRTSTLCFYSPWLSPNLIFPMPLYNESQSEECWIHDMLIGHRCLDGCRRNPKPNLWKSNFMSKLQYFPYTWQPYDCKLPLYSNPQIKACFESRNYAYPTTTGDSVPYMFSFYIKQRFEPLLNSNTSFGTRKVVIANHKFLHHLWHDSDDAFVASMSNKKDGLQTEKDSNTTTFFFLGPFLSSERQVHVLQGRLERFSTLLSPLLKEYGWMELNWVNVSMALSYEAAAQYDGLHVLGNSMKMAFQMIMHQLCS